jgi:tetraprenyl-beta-curcumene synthase
MLACRRYAAALGSAGALATYWLVIFPRARRELRHWEGRARGIRDPRLRRLALDKLRDEGTCAEGVAAFALLAATNRRQVVRLCVAFEVMYDFIDGLGEQPVVDPLANNRRLALALVAAVDPAAPLVDFYAAFPREEGTYLNELIAVCRGVLATLPCFALVAFALRRAAVRAGEAQSLNHAGALAGDLRPLERWATLQWPPGELRWWETAASAAAPLAIYALCALATDCTTCEDDVARVEAAYFPWIAGLLGVLESLVDREEDTAAGTHSFVEHYASRSEVVTRAGVFARRSTGHVRALPRATRHRVILAGMVATNLSHGGAGDETAADAGAAVRANVDGPVKPLLAALRLRRRLMPRKRVGLAASG